MIRSKKCSVMLNEAPIPEYHVTERVGPFLSPISIDSIQKAFLKSSGDTKRSIIDLAMSITMINMHCESEKQRIPLIPSWTGFNSLLLQEAIYLYSIVTQLS